MSARSADGEVGFRGTVDTQQACGMNASDLASPQTLLTTLYSAFNARDIPRLLASMTPDVSWPNGWEGGVLHGRDAVGDYWRRQWDQLQPTVVPTAFATEEDGRIAVTVHQVVRDTSGEPLTDQTVTHVYRLVDGLVAAMEIRG